MPRFNVEADGKWACFSGISEEFITPFMPRPEYEKWREEEYGAENVPIEQANQKTLAEALFMLSLNHRRDQDILDNLRFAGLLLPKWEDREECASATSARSAADRSKRKDRKKHHGRV